MRISERLMGLYFNADEGGGGGSGAENGSGGEGSGDGGNSGGDGGKTYDEAYVKKLRDEAAANRKKAADAEKRLKEIDEANLSEAEKLKKRADDAEAKATAIQSRVVKAEVRAAAAAANFADPGDAYALIADQIELDANGEPQNVEALIKKLAETKPYLVKQSQAAGGGSAANAASDRRNGGGSKFDPKRPPSWGNVFKS